ncbi:MAG: hypothetical protein Q4E47_02895 [Candidatus Saccharibacteria bacterium]|nr:hypothetical protein [Candidatus Saccharibacteria bacterium]
MPATTAPKSKDLKGMDIKDFIRVMKKRITGKDEDALLMDQTGKYEVNLVPEIKLQMIKTQKLRNLVLFVCIVIAVVCGGTIAVFGSVIAGQAVSMAHQDEHIDDLSNRVMGYGELTEFLTIQDQLDKLSSIVENKKVLSRVFPILASLLPTGRDKIILSELDVNLEDYTLSFDAQANAGEDPDIDYRVLESFKKSVNSMTYDYGRYVDSKGNEIPTRCIDEVDANGVMYSEKGAIYAIWRRGETGCDPEREDYVEDEDGNVSTNRYDPGHSSSSLDNTAFTGADDDGIGTVVECSGNKCDNRDKEEEEDEEEEEVDENAGNKVFCPDGSVATSYDGCKKDNDKNNSDEKITHSYDVIPNEKIWRTPQFKIWYNPDPEKQKTVKTRDDGLAADIQEVIEDDVSITYQNIITYQYTPSMSLDGTIEKVPHFESECITYTGEEVLEYDGKVKIDDDGNPVIKWSAENTCKMAAEDIVIESSSNGRNTDGDLVLRFSAIISLDPDVFAFKNKHVMSITPYRQNMTDSYIQIEGMFGAPAVDCEVGDKECFDERNSGSSN